MTPKRRTFQTELIEAVSAETGLYRYQVKKVFEATTQFIVRNLIAGKEVHVLSLGKFWLARSCARKAFNPRACKPLWLEDRLLPKFKWGRKIYETIKKEATNKGLHRDTE